MVERFNKTIVSMLSTFVSDMQKDWDKHISYVMIACRSSEHETNGVLQHLLLLGRELSTPLGIVYEMRPSIKPISSRTPRICSYTGKTVHRRIKEKAK